MEHILQTRGLSVEFSGFKAISELDFKLNRGELRVVLGPNGAGKTTLMDLITGKTKPTSGKVIFNKIDITGKEPYSIARLGIGRKFQGPNIFDNMTVYENIKVSFRGIHEVKKALFHRTKADIENKVEHILDKINLKNKSRHMANTLSHGEKQWLEMGMLLAQDPELIILDEPTTGMTAEETYKTGEIIQNLFKGHSVVVVEHDMAFVRQVARTVTVLHQGKFLAEGTLEEIEQNKEVQDVYLAG